MSTKIHSRKTVLMQRLIDSFIRGYHWHTSGIISRDKLQDLERKFAEKYGTDLNKNQRAYRRKKGMAISRLFFLEQSHEEGILWWLLATDGEGAIHQEEKLRDARDRRGRIRMGGDYELVRVTKPGRSGVRGVATWRMTKEREKKWRARIVSACNRMTDKDIKEIMHSLYRTPGFSGIRKQVGSLVALAKRKWRRRHGKGRVPGARESLGFVQRLGDEEVSGD